MTTYDVDHEELSFCPACLATPKIQSWLDSAEDRIVDEWDEPTAECSNCQA